jgi:serine/threonine protein kinase
MHTEATGLDATVLAELQPDLEVLRPLGSGDTANVYLAREPALQRLVAVKVLRPDVAADTVARQRFEREAQ